LNKTYINAVSIRSALGNTVETIDGIFEKNTLLKSHSSLVPEKTVCIGKFNSDKNFEELLLESVNEVLESSELKDFSNTLLLVGSSVGGMATGEKVFFQESQYKNINISKHVIEVIASTLDKKYSFYATRSFSTACTSSANALKVAKELISLGAYDNILIVGADEICLTTIFGFSSLGILSDELCTPFQKDRKGMNVAEGIGVLLVQNKKYENSIELLGAGTSSDAYHIANPDPTAQGATTAMQNALDDASLNGVDINYINAHGTGTQANDAIEAKAINSIFSNSTYISSTKANTGHTLGASGAIEAIICIEVIKRGLIPPQIKCDLNEADLSIVGSAKKIDIKFAMSNSFAFGGNNTSLVFGVCDEN